MLDSEEYIEQTYFFRTLAERMEQNIAAQDLLVTIKEELLATTKLPMALDFLAGELKLTGGFATAMARMQHYFTSFQAYVIGEAENDRGRFDLKIALAVLQREAEYRSREPTPQGAFVFQFETLCRNRLGYDKGLDAISRDPIYDRDWAEWIRTVRHQVGLVDFADMIFVRSQHYQNLRVKQGLDTDGPPKPILFGEREGKIALANRRKDPLLLFSALERHLGYPTVPRPQAPDEQKHIIPQLLRRVERLESRLKLLEEEEKGGIDITKFYGKSPVPPPDDPPTASRKRQRPE